MPIGSSSGVYYQDEGELLVDQNKPQALLPLTAKEKSDRNQIQENEKAGSFQNRFDAIPRLNVYRTMPVGSPTEPTGALKSSGGTNIPGKQYETKLSSEEEIKFQTWKQQNAPKDSGEDYDFRGAFKAGEQPGETGHWSDVYKKPNHPTFSDQSMYAKDRPDLAGHWVDENGKPAILGKTYVPPGATYVNPWITITPEDIDKSINIGLSAGPGTMAGVKSATINTDKLMDAMRMAGEGQLDKSIWRKTGFGKGSEGKWRYEIDDSKSILNTDWKDNARVNSATGEQTSALTKVLDHPELYKAYPQLQDIRVVHDPKYPSAGAEWDAANKTIRVGSEAAQNKGTLMHEVQHVIQDIEGFAKGGAPGTAGVEYNLKLDKAMQEHLKWARGRMDDINAKYAKKGALGLTDKDLNDMDYITDVAAKYQKYQTAGDKEAHDYYLRLAGEVEARNVANRLHMTLHQRRILPPKGTLKELGGEDIPPEQQIPTSKSALATAYGVEDPITGQMIKSKSEPINFRRAANDNKNLDLGTGGVDVDKAWNELAGKLKKGDAIRDEMNKISSKDQVSDFEHARYKKLVKQYFELFPPSSEE